MDDQEFRREVIAHISAIEAVISVLAKDQAQPEFRQAVMRALTGVTADLDTPTHMYAETISRKIMGVSE